MIAVYSLQLQGKNACIVLKKKQRSKTQIYVCIIILVTMPGIFKQLHGENLPKEKLNQNTVIKMVKL